MFESIWDNDAALEFFAANDYPNNYNDGLYAYLSDVYPIHVGGRTLPDLLSRYRKEYGDTFNMAILGKSGVASYFVAVAATFTNAVPTAGVGSTIVLTSAGAHGLTSAVAVGQRIYISAGTNWTLGFYTITAIDVDTTGVAITITGTFSASLGNATVAPVATEVPLLTVAVPILQANSMIRADISTYATDTSAATKIHRVKLNTTNLSGITLTTLPNSRRVTVIHNTGATNAQVSGITSTTIAGEGSGAAAAPTGAVDTSVATTITATLAMSIPNIIGGVSRYIVEVFK
jgi:hypothetical protein